MVLWFCGCMVLWFRVFMVVWFYGFMVFWFYGFVVPWFHSFMAFMVLWFIFYGFKKYQIYISCFQKEIGPISEIFKMLFKESSGFSVPDVQECLCKMLLEGGPPHVAAVAACSPGAGAAPRSSTRSEGWGGVPPQQH